MFRAPDASMDGCGGEAALGAGGYSTVVRSGRIASFDSPGVPIAGLDYRLKLMGTTVAWTAGRVLKDVRRALDGCRRRGENMDGSSVVRTGPTANIPEVSRRSGWHVQRMSKKTDGRVSEAAGRGTSQICVRTPGWRSPRFNSLLDNFSDNCTIDSTRER